MRGGRARGAGLKQGRGLGTLSRPPRSYCHRGKRLSSGLGGGLCSRGRPRLLAECCSHGTLRGVAEVAALGSQPGRLVRGPAACPALPQPRLLSPPPGLSRRQPKASRIFRGSRAAAGSAAGERLTVLTVGMRGTGISLGQVALERE